MASYWIHYHMRLFEPHWYGTPAMVEECLSLMEKNGEEDKSFRECVVEYVNNNFDHDNFHISDKRICRFLAKNLEAKTSFSEIMKDWNEFVRQRRSRLLAQEELNEEFKTRILQEFEDYKCCHMSIGM